MRELKGLNVGKSLDVSKRIQHTWLSFPALLKVASGTLLAAGFSDAPP